METVETRPFCPRCEEEYTIALHFSDLIGCCYRCQNCDEEFPLTDIDRLFKEFKF